MMMLNWARTTCGMMGRSPDFMNVTLRLLGRRGRLLRRAAGRSSATTCAATIEYIRENDLVLTHSLINLQRSRNVIRHVQPAGRHRAAGDHARPPPASSCAARACWRRWARSPTRSRCIRHASAQHTEDHSPFASSFAIPCDTPGLRFLCRDSFDQGSSHFDHPLGSRFEEMDCIVFFDDVLVPWERVFIYGDVGLLNSTAYATHSSAHTAHQGCRQEPGQVRVRAGRRAADDRDAGQHAPAAHRGAYRRADDVPRS